MEREGRASIDAAISAVPENNYPVLVVARSNSGHYSARGFTHPDKGTVTYLENNVGGRNGFFVACFTIGNQLGMCNLRASDFSAIQPGKVATYRHEM